MEADCNICKNKRHDCLMNIDGTCDNFKKVNKFWEKNAETKPIPMAVSIDSMSIKSMKEGILRHLDKSDSMVRTLYEVLFLEKTGHKVEIFVGDSDLEKKLRKKEN